jgi:hypothetical protein
MRLGMGPRHWRQDQSRIQTFPLRMVPIGIASRAMTFPLRPALSRNSLGSRASGYEDSHGS